MDWEGVEAAPASSSTDPTTGTTTALSVTASRPDTPIYTKANLMPLSNPPSDRQTVQVIQQTMHRPTGLTAQYLQQMYSAQQQHIMLQTAALHQQQQPVISATQSPASTQQGPQSNNKQPTSPPHSSKGSVAQSVISLSTSPVMSQPVSQLQAISTSGTISQQAMLLSNGSSPGSQAQMYLRTQMLILAPAATMAADLPARTSGSSQPVSTQVPSLALRTHLPGALTSAQSIHLKTTSQGQTMVPPLSKMSICSLKSAQLSQTLAETSKTLSPVQSHAVVCNQLHCASTQKGAPPPPPQFILQSSSAKRQVQPIALRVMAQDSSPPPLSLLTRTTPTPCAIGEILSVPTSSDHLNNQSSVQHQAVMVSPSTLPAGCPTLPDPPPLHLGPMMEPLSHSQTLSGPPPLTLALPRLANPSPSTLQRLSLRSVHALAVQSDQVLISEHEVPVAEALVQLPFQNLLPPQTVAVDLKVHPSTQTEAPSAGQQMKDEGPHVDLTREKEPVSSQQSRTPTPPGEPEEPQSTCPDQDSAESEHCAGPAGYLCMQSSQSTIRSPEESVPTVSTSTNTTSPPPFHCAAVRSSSRLLPASLPASPESWPSQATVRPHILTHLIEGFVIREGLEPFPVGLTSLESQQQARQPVDQEVAGNEEPTAHGFLLNADQQEKSSDSDMDKSPPEDVQTKRKERSPSNLLQCKFCGKSGYVHTFLRSNRFCSMACVKRFNISCTKRFSMLKVHRVGRWPNRPMGRRGRPPSRIHRTSREDFLRQFKGYRQNNKHLAPKCPSQGKGEEGEPEEEEEEDLPAPMTTRLRLQKERKRNCEQRGMEDCSSSTCLSKSSPSQWSVEQVCSYISSLPGCQDVAPEFCTQEIDGQAMLLLTEEHLISTMNIKLGPALKICAHINTLKEA